MSGTLFSELSSRRRSALGIASMLLAVFALYCPAPVLTEGHTIVGADYYTIHLQRLWYARETFSADTPYLAAWHTRELLGAPFWSNIQSFPFSPARLALLPFDPRFAFTPAVLLAALLGALFAYLYARKLGLGIIASACTGWTFSAGGYFASRVACGHLPLLEAYASLPLLLFLVEIALSSVTTARRTLPLLALALAAAAVALSGHPQLPIYSLGVALFYALYRARNRWGITMAASLLLGAGLASFSLVPFGLLVARSTRLLALDAPGNDIPFPYGRLGSLVFPWQDGHPYFWGQKSTFAGYPDPAYFWDTVVYIGRVPIAAAAILAGRALWLRRRPERPFGFIAALGVLALVTALPFVSTLRELLPGTLLRSPSRQLYLTTFALAIGLGVAIEVLLRALARRTSRVELYGLGVLVFAHVADLWTHDRWFVLSQDLARGSHEAVNARPETPDGRVALDHRLLMSRRSVDDPGFFDSVMLARPYRALMELSGEPAGKNEQLFSGSELSRRALAATATERVVTLDIRDDLTRLTRGLYAVPDAAKRASFIDARDTSYLATADIHEKLRDPAYDTRSRLMLPAESPRLGSGAPSAAEINAATVEYRRPSSDLIVASVRTGRAGYLRIIESFDPGWSATLDGRPVPVLAADDFALAVGVERGEHEIRLSYATPGARAGLALSLLSAGLLAALLVAVRRRAESPLRSPPAGAQGGATAESSSSTWRRSVARIG